MKTLFAKISPVLIRKEARADVRNVTDDEKRLADICALIPEEAMRRLNVDLRGLNSEEEASRRETYGSNEINTGKKGGLLAEFLTRFRNPLVIQLLVIAVVSFSMGDFRSGIVVGGMIVLSVGLAFFQETRSTKAVEKLKSMIQTNATVIRGEKQEEIPFSELVPGDIVVLDAGTMIPADLRLLRSKDLFISQSALTGESMPVEKTATQCNIANRNVLSLESACFQGTSVVSGAGLGLVVNTGNRTIFGAISSRLAGAGVETSFDKGIKGFTWLMVLSLIHI